MVKALPLGLPVQRKAENRYNKNIFILKATKKPWNVLLSRAICLKIVLSYFFYLARKMSWNDNSHKRFRNDQSRGLFPLSVCTEGKFQWRRRLRCPSFLESRPIFGGEVFCYHTKLKNFPTPLVLTKNIYINIKFTQKRPLKNAVSKVPMLEEDDIKYRIETGRGIVRNII